MRTNKRIVFWTGTGFSYGSQNEEHNRPPLGENFFAYSQVRTRIQCYPVLAKTWEIYGSPKNLEKFWWDLDTHFNEAKSFTDRQQAQLKKCLAIGVEKPVSKGLKDYYQLYNEGFKGDISSRIRAVAGFELKALLIDVLKGPEEKKLLLHLWRAIPCAFRILTFNYDLFAERTLAKVKRVYAYKPTLQESTVDCLKLHGSLQWVHKKSSLREGPDKFCWRDRDGKLTRKLGLKVIAPSGRFVGDKFYLNDPLIIGLRQKREFTIEEQNPLVRNFFGSLLSDSQVILREARKVIVIGFSFQEADKYLWDNLSEKQVGGGKRLLCCYMSQYRTTRDRKYEERVQNFFGTDGDFCPLGFSRGFVEQIKDFL